jgi:hypothetical protein
MTLVFISGPVAITVRDWEQRGEVSDGGARTGLRRGEQAEGLNHRAGRWFHGLTGQRWPVAASGPVSGSYPVRERRASAISRSPATTTSVSASSKDELTADPAKRIAASWPTSPAR